MGLWWRGCSGLVVEGLQRACGGGAAVGLWWRGCSGLVVEGLQWACGRGAAVGLWWSIDVCCSTFLLVGATVDLETQQHKGIACIPPYCHYVPNRVTLVTWLYGGGSFFWVHVCVDANVPCRHGPSPQFV